MSSFFEAWVSRLKVSWMGPNARAIFGGLAAALGDKSYDWAQQGVLEHLPETASTKSLVLTASERQLETAISEAASTMADREPYASWIHKFDGTPLRMLLGLHFAGFDGAYVVQENGRAYSLTLPLPAFGLSTWDPTPNLVTATTTTLAGPITSALKLRRSIPAGTPWLSLADSELTNRFAVIFPTWSFAALVPAFFNNTDSAAVTWPVAFSSSSYNVIWGPPTDNVVVYNDGTAQTASGTTIRATAPWYGTAWVTAFPDGVNPLNTFSSESADLIQQVIQSCRPEKAYCVGVYAYLTSTGAWGWPIRKFGNGDKWGATSVKTILGSF